MYYVFYNKKQRLISYGLSIVLHAIICILFFCSFVFNLEKYDVVFVDFTPDNTIYNSNNTPQENTDDEQQVNSQIVDKQINMDVIMQAEEQAVIIVDEKYVSEKYQIHDHKKAHVKFLASMDAKRIYAYEEMLPMWFLQFKPKIDKSLNKIRVVLDITIDKDGVIRNMKLTNASGNDEIDKLILDMAQKANPVPPPPDLKEGSLQRFYLPLLL